jgi:hypothetical protein
LVTGVENANSHSFGEPPGWTQRVAAQNSFGSARLTVFSRVGDGSSSDDGVGLLNAAPAAGWQSTIYVIDGADISAPIDVSLSANQNSGANPTVPGVTTTGPDRLLLSWLFTTGADVTGDPSGWTPDAENEPSANSLYCYSKTAATAGSYGGETITVPSHAGVRITVAITPAVEGGGISGDAVPVAAHSRAVAAVGSFGAIPGPISEAIETLRPNSTVYNGDTPPWVGDPDATDLHENVNETSPNDSTVIYLPDGSAFFGNNIRLGLPTPVGTVRTGEDPSGHVVRVRIASADDGVPITPSGTPEWSLDLWQDSVAKAPRSSAAAELPALTGAWQDVSYELTEAEAAGITDYSLLLVSITGRTQSTTYGVAVSYVAVEVPVLVPTETPVAVPVSAQGRAVAALGEFGGATPTDGDAVPANVEARAAASAGTFGGLAADTVPAQTAAQVVPATAALGGLAGDAVPSAVHARVSPAAGALGGVAGSAVPVATVARAAASDGAPGGLAGGGVPGAVFGAAVAAQGSLGALAGASVPVAVHATAIAASASDITPIAGEGVPVAGTVQAVGASGAFGELAGATVSTTAEGQAVPAAGTFGGVAGSTVPVRASGQAARAAGAFGGLAASTVPVSALAFAAPSDGESDILTIAGQAVPAQAIARGVPTVGAFGPLAGTMVPAIAQLRVVPVSGAFGGLTATLVSAAAFARAVPGVLSFVDPNIPVYPLRVEVVYGPLIAVELVRAPLISVEAVRAPLISVTRGAS